MEDLYSYMIWGNYNQRMEELAGLTIPEQWSFTGKDDNGILKNFPAAVPSIRSMEKKGEAGSFPTRADTLLLLPSVKSLRYSLRRGITR